MIHKQENSKKIKKEKLHKKYIKGKKKKKGYHIPHFCFLEGML